MKTVPQIFFGNKFIGGCSDLLAMDESGELDILIKGEDDATSID
jgi:glutaredoxin-related protein